MDDRATGYLVDRLATAEVEDALMKADALAGNTAVIDDPDLGTVFNWESTLTTGPELLGQRDTDLRIEQNSRPTREQKREVHYQVMGVKSATRKELWTERQQGIWIDPDAEKGSK